MDYEKHIKEFAIIAKEFCTWVEESDKQEQIQLYILQVMLSKLYCWGIQLPDCEATDFFQNENLPEHNHNEVLKYFKEFPVQYYSMVFNANIVPSEDPVVGDIIDDLADIYKDLKDGLWYLEQGREIDAVFQWRFSFGVHWARHILGAMYALYCTE